MQREAQVTVSCSFFLPIIKKSLNIVFEHILSCSFGTAVIASRYVFLAFSKGVIYLYLNTGRERNEHLHRFTPKNLCPGSLVRFLIVIHWFGHPIICSAWRESILPINWQQTLGKWQIIWMRVWRLSLVISCPNTSTPNYLLHRQNTQLGARCFLSTCVHLYTPHRIWRETEG